jgi:hypothetical protein
MEDENLAPGECTDPVIVAAPPELRDRDEFMALLTIRPLDGGELQRIAGLADTEDYARAEVFHTMRAALGQVQKNGTGHSCCPRLHQRGEPYA